VGCRGMIVKGFGFVAFFAGIKTISFCIHLFCLVCSLSVVRGEWSRLFCSLKRRNLPEVSIASFLPPQFFVSCEAVKVQFSDPYKYVGKTKVLYNFTIVSNVINIIVILFVNNSSAVFFMGNHEHKTETYRVLTVIHCSHIDH
jgi:hypothetical protein